MSLNHKLSAYEYKLLTGKNTVNEFSHTHD